MLGYEKNEKLEFNYKKSCGLWLIAIAIVIAVAVLIGGQQIINMQVFSIGYVVCFFSINMNKNLLKNHPLDHRLNFKIRFLNSQ